MSLESIGDKIVVRGPASLNWHLEDDQSQADAEPEPIEGEKPIGIEKNDSKEDGLKHDHG